MGITGSSVATAPTCDAQNFSLLYNASMSPLVLKEHHIFLGKYTKHANLTSEDYPTYVNAHSSFGWCKEDAEADLHGVFVASTKFNCTQAKIVIQINGTDPCAAVQIHGNSTSKSASTELTWKFNTPDISQPLVVSTEDPPSCTPHQCTKWTCSDSTTCTCGDKEFKKNEGEASCSTWKSGDVVFSCGCGDVRLQCAGLCQVCGITDDCFKLKHALLQMEASKVKAKDVSEDFPYSVVIGGVVGFLLVMGLAVAAYLVSKRSDKTKQPPQKAKVKNTPAE